MMAENFEAAALLEHSSFFRGLSTAHVSHLAPRIRLKTIARGELMARRGEQAAFVFIIKSGDIKVSRRVQSCGYPGGTLPLPNSL